MKNKQELNQGRRAFLRRLGMGAGAAVAMTMMEKDLLSSHWPRVNF